MKKTILKGSCLARRLETQASDSTGFRYSLKQFVEYLDESKTAYDRIPVDDPGVRCPFVASMVKWAHLVNYRLIDYLEKISKGECDEVLTLNFAKFCNKDHWLSGRIRSDMMGCSDKPLKEYLIFGAADQTSMDLYRSYESNVTELAENLKKVKSTFNQPELYENLMQQMVEQYAEHDIAYEYEQMKDHYIEPALNDYLKMQVKACVEFLKSGMLNDILSISNEDAEDVDEEKLHKMLDSRCKVPDNLKELWAKLKKFIVLKANVMLVLRHDLILKHVLKHFDKLYGEHFCALFKLERLLQMIHQDMVKLNPELAKQLEVSDGTNTFGIVNSLTRLIQQPWFKEFRTDAKYDHAWIEKFVSDLVASEYRQTLLEIWQDADKRLTLKGNIIGCLKMAGVIDGSDLGIAAALLNGSDKENKTFAIYMGKGRKMSFCDWTCDYVKH